MCNLPPLGEGETGPGFGTQLQTHLSGLADTVGPLSPRKDTLDDK